MLLSERSPSPPPSAHLSPGALCPETSWPIWQQHLHLPRARWSSGSLGCRWVEQRSIQGFHVQLQGVSHQDGTSKQGSTFWAPSFSKLTWQTWGLGWAGKGRPQRRQCCAACSSSEAAPAPCRALKDGQLKHPVGKSARLSLSIPSYMPESSSAAMAVTTTSQASCSGSLHALAAEFKMGACVTCPWGRAGWRLRMRPNQEGASARMPHISYGSGIKPQQIISLKHRTELFYNQNLCWEQLIYIVTGKLGR